MDKKIILFDIDKTLLNPYPIMDDLADKINNKFHKEIDVFEIYNEYVKKLDSSTDFYPKDFLELVSKKTKISFTEINSYFYNPKIWESYVYEGTKDFLNKIKFNFNLGIFSEGFRSFQNKKLKMSKLDIFFKKDLTFISRRKLNNVFLKTIPKEVIIVDDKKEVIETLKKLRPDLNLIWINRIDDTILEGIKTIKNLRELENLI